MRSWAYPDMTETMADRLARALAKPSKLEEAVSKLPEKPVESVVSQPEPGKEKTYSLMPKSFYFK